MLMLRPAFLRTSIRANAMFQSPHYISLLPRVPSPTARRIPAHNVVRALTGQSGPPTPGNDAPNPVDDATDKHHGPEEENKKEKYRQTAFKMFEAAMTTLASISVLGLFGYSYTKYYKYMVLEKIEGAFRPGDPVLELASAGKGVPKEGAQQKQKPSDIPGIPDQAEYDRWIPRVEQAKIDAIVAGQDTGRYHLIMGEKGTGKSSMLIDAMSKIDGEGVAMCEAHADPEIFRIRLGRCLDFEFHEDNIGALFSIRGPRDASALLDIERALNKLEKVALNRRKRVGRPLILIINQAHLLRDDENGRDLIELLQQRAEQWAASNLATVIINSDKYWVYERLKQHATRMEITQISDLPKARAIEALRNYRMKYWMEKTPLSILEEVYDKIGGRLTYLNRVAKMKSDKEMIGMCNHICNMEKTWFLNNCGILGEEMDDDVMDQQKYAVSCDFIMLILLFLFGVSFIFSRLREDQFHLIRDILFSLLFLIRPYIITRHYPSLNRQVIGPSTAMVLALALHKKSQEEEHKSYDSHTGHILPSFPLHEARYIMTRADFIRQHHDLSIFSIDSHAIVRADSVPMQRAFDEVCSAPGFEAFLEATLKRIGDIESLGRTKELTFKDLWEGGKYRVTTVDRKGNLSATTEMEIVEKPEEEEDGEEGGKKGD
ncbi:hypothetical protein P154DRAFT_624520 [Amniculicola lignicola CBS 123094]|uniref:Orc1-like AAA ATPase domain-containing protein n=1 Tax=Amniculicola lignicola CBS 123094 TaxID=1392246 RepID=A0A6A5WAQ5_9PLEO|nr:hypothetical protein P154DRAFT_624520 [Amniculicola lignicola CBS 123094]